MYGKLGKALAATMLVATATAGISMAQEAARAPLDRVQSVYGLAIDPAGNGSLLLASGYGLLRATPDGMAEIVTPPSAAVVGLATDPNAPQKLVLSGVSETGDPAGLYTLGADASTWSAVPGTEGETGVILTSLSVSPLDGAKLAGLDKTIRLSADGGLNWTSLETTPENTFSVALSGAEPNRIFASTMNGVLVSEDNGESWQESYSSEAPATVVTSLSGGRIAAFVYGTGLVMADETSLDWQVVGTGFEDRYLRALTEDPASPDTLYAVVDTGAILLSRNGGKSWTGFEGNDLADPETIAAGKTLYDNNCASCHGANGIGEAPDDPGATDDFGFKAPALNNDMHAWHHSDAGLRATIGEGSPRNERMIPWQEVLSDEEIDTIIAYVKSTWSVRSFACQGARHGTCMGQ
ncbi:c-type cytochrome [Aliiroseovarius sp.]|uniref:c-type cytochrome n=1 Tax=Aliiroseovarius sp. TaxID=1872442 RepID=UPI0026359B6B|nr:c-type cytochrome [Aliiroseovarius sp.]